MFVVYADGVGGGAGAPGVVQYTRALSQMRLVLLHTVAQVRVCDGT